MIAENPDNEKELLFLVSGGDENAFRQVYDKYYKRIYSYAINLTEDEDTALELMQEVFLKVWLNRDKLPEVTHFSAWIYTIAKNQFFDALKKMTREKTFRKKLSDLSDGSSNETEYLILDKENESLLRQAIEKLPPQQKAIFELRGQGFKQDEIAQKLNISRNTVKVHLTRALHSIKEYLKGHTGSLTILMILVTQK